jgi:kynurenine formamidase
MDRMPSYDELPGGSATGVFGESDALGCLNHLTPERVAQGARLVEKGVAFSLNAPVDWPSPPLFARKPVWHYVIKKPVAALTGTASREDYLDSFYPQASSQWDGFLHVWDPVSRTFYNGRTNEEVGTEAWAERGIAGRGVLLDLARWAEHVGEPIDWQVRRAISVPDLEACAEWHQVEIQPGDILLLRTGWTAGYESSTHEFKLSLGGGYPAFPGLEASEQMAARLWDWQISAVASDNPALEAFPIELPEFLHIYLLPRLGIPIGELWWMERLADDCADDGRYAFFFTSAPLNVKGGIGSPANALAVT